MISRSLSKISLALAFVSVVLSSPGYISQGTAPGCDYWVAPPPTGDDSNPGTIGSPWASLKHASDSVPDDQCTVWFEDGDYSGGNRLNRRFSSLTTFKSIYPYQAVLKNDSTVVAISGGTNITLEGFVFSHSGPGASSQVVAVDQSKEGWAEYITLRNNIFHDSFNDDLLKIYSGVRFVTVENNIFYNQGSKEEHMDVNSVTDVTIQDNIFFNDFAGSGRSDPGNTKAFITVKDSNENDDGLLGSERIDIRRNIFLNWQGGEEPFLQIGNDGKPYHEAKFVRIENNLMIGNSHKLVNALLDVSGAKDVIFANNTVVGDLPSKAYAFRLDQKGLNPQNENIYFHNNIWSDPTGTMGADLSGKPNEFSDGDPEEVSNLILDNNLYGNGPLVIPPGDLVSPTKDDAHRIVANPLLNSHHENMVLPRWTGSAFLSGNLTIRQEFERLVELYGNIPPYSPAVERADPAFAPPDDILGRARSTEPDLGAYEAPQPFFNPGTFSLFTSPAETLERILRYLTGE